MAEVIIYTRAGCGYCVRAKQLLDKKNVKYTEVRIDEQPERRQEMIERSGRQTVPQIFIDKKSIGGCDDLHALEEAGKLDKLLQH